MQINKNIKISAILASLILVSGCTSTSNQKIFVKDNLTKEIEFNKKNPIIKDNQDFFKTDEEILYINYSDKMKKKSDSMVTKRSNFSEDFLLPLMHIKIDDVNELEQVIENVSEVYNLKIDSEAYEYLNTHIYNDTVIDLSQRRCTYEEMVKKISFKFDLVYERINNDFHLHLFETKSFFIPSTINFDTKLALNGGDINKDNVFDTIRSFMTTATPNNFNYDEVSNVLYVRDVPKTLSRIEKYIENISKLTNIQYNIDMFFINFSNKEGKEIDWELMQKQLENFKYISKVEPLSSTSISLDSNSEVDTKNEVLYHFLELLKRQGSAEISYSTQFKTINQKAINYKRGNDFTFISNCSTDIKNGKPLKIETKDGDSYFNINITPSYDLNNNLNNISIKKSMKELISLNKVEFNNGCSIEKPIFNKIVSNDFFSVKDNSYIIMNSSRDLKNFESVMNNEELTDIHGKVNEEINKGNSELSGSIILFKINKLDNRNIIH